MFASFLFLPVVNVYTTHLGDVSCSPTLSNMIRTDTALNSLLTHKPPEALLTQQTTSSAVPTLIGHSLFNPTTTAQTSAAAMTMDTSGAELVGDTITSAAAMTMDTSGAELVGDTIVDLNDHHHQIDLAGASLITIDGSTLDDRLHHGGGAGDDV
ncbi:conserved hypothetical protein [Culex quinquefasciatus]|uniref:Uncharacterized protein n=1 Tax=Culex quinquefasciatus TaxID=7176 RepID=B0WV24_CULQU|nr:conserved hypothetical protein [Culex quinquefasciatus]|eukprot:XP_001871008.1 conserved hypothetical protein [Culex quinquefasciatus]